MVTAPWRRVVACSLVVAPVVLLGSGCKTAGGWRAPWSAWSGASSSNSTALNISKPSTQAPSPSTTPGQANRGLAAGGGANAPGANPSGVAVAGATAPAGGVAAYPATPQADAYPTQPAGGAVAPAGGGQSNQVGPYSMQSNPATSGYAGGQPRGTPATPAGYGGAPRGSAPAANPAEGPYGGREDYRTADRGAAPGYSGGAAAGGAPAEAAATEEHSAYGGGEAAATAPEASVYGPAEEASPASGGNNYSPASNSENEVSEESASPRAYGPPNTVAPSRPSTSPPAAGGAGRSTLPQSLSNAGGGYRPGSTGGYGARNADFEQTQNASTQDNSPDGGTTYR